MIIVVAKNENQLNVKLSWGKWINLGSGRFKQRAQSTCNVFRHGGTEMLDWTYNNWFKKRIFERKQLSMEILMEEFQPMYRIKPEIL